MSKKSKKIAQNKEIKQLWADYITATPGFLAEYKRLYSWYVKDLGRRNRWFYANYNSQILPYIQLHAGKIGGNYPMMDKVNMFREMYEND